MEPKRGLKLANKHKLDVLFVIAQEGQFVEKASLRHQQRKK
ncbi:MAG: hypothetical protein R3A45_01665 [Bdellovibrionota bacterium]